MRERRPHPRDGFRIRQSADESEVLFEEALDLPDYPERAGWAMAGWAHAIYTIRELERDLAALRRHAPEAVDEEQRPSLHYRDYGDAA